MVRRFVPLNKMLLLLCCSCFFCPGCLADRKLKSGKDEKKQLGYYLPNPDTFPVALVAEKRVLPLAEPQFHTVSSKNRPGAYYGIDVSRYQGDIDWDEVRRDGRVSFVYLKATESTGLVDCTYACNLSGARRVGLPVGVYHFFSPNTPAHQQLANFTRTVDLHTQDLIPIVDVEVIPRRKVHLAAFLKRLRAFVDGVEAYFGCKPMIYTSQSFYNSYLTGKFLDCPFMFARYAGDVPEVNDNVRFLVWQFTASGRVRGISCNVDRSCLMNSCTVEDIRYRPVVRK